MLGCEVIKRHALCVGVRYIVGESSRQADDQRPAQRVLTQRRLERMACVTLPREN